MDTLGIICLSSDNLMPTQKLLSYTEMINIVGVYAASYDFVLIFKRGSYQAMEVSFAETFDLSSPYHQEHVSHFLP